MASGLPSIIISGTVKLLRMSNLYLAPFLTSRTIEFLVRLQGVFFLVAKVRVTFVYYPGASLTLSGVILKSVVLRIRMSKDISIGKLPTFLYFKIFFWVLPTITFPKSQIQEVKNTFSYSLV